GERLPAVTGRWGARLGLAQRDRRRGEPLRRAPASCTLQCRELPLYGSELTNALKQLPFCPHAQCRSLRLADLGADRYLKGIDRPLLCLERLLLELDRMQRLLRVLGLARVRKTGVDEP